MHSKNLRLLLISILLFLSLGPARAQLNSTHKPDGNKISSSTIDKEINRLMNAADVMGLQIGIISNNKITYVKSYGYKNKALNQLNDTSTIFYAASLSKSLFAYLVMMLVDENKIDLDKPLYKYLPKPLPEYDNYKDLATDERWKLITARHCLSHTTGFPNLRQFNPHENNKLEIFFTPGSRYAYSGEGINLLQFVVEIITYKKLEDLAQEKIFKPFGMTHTSYIWQQSFEKNYAIGYDLNSEPLEKRKRSKAYAAGSMETTAADYTRFVNAVMLGKRLSAKAESEMLSPQIIINEKKQFPSLNNDTTSENRKIKLSYGLGWGIFYSPFGKVFFKEGHDDGWVNYVMAVPSKKFAIILFSNSSAGESIYKELVKTLSGITIPYEWENYMPYTPHISLPENTLKQFVGEYEGKLNAKITLANGVLKAESSTTGLTPSNLYPVNDHHFFLKVMDVQIDFIKAADGKVEKMIVLDEGEKYELKKIN